MDWERCYKESLPFDSPVTDLANRLLQGDPNNGDQGLLVRTIDKQFDRSISEVLRHHDVFSKPPLPQLHYVPSSYLHASMRASGAIFEDPEFGSFSIMVGTKFSNNTSMERFQSKGKSVGCDFVYPTDDTSIERGTLSFQDAVAASNSMWLHRERWSIDSKNPPLAYHGYTECASPVKIGQVDLADAIIMPLHRNNDDAFVPQTACHEADHYDIERRFIMAQERGYGDHPVLWYRESMGILDVQECIRLFNGNGCEEAWHKEFFSQEIELPNHSCVHKPPGCDEAYFFPADSDRCSAHTKKGKKRIARLCRAEKEQDARLAWEGMLEKEPLNSFFLARRGMQQTRNEPPVLRSMRGTKLRALRIDQYSTKYPPFWLVNLGLFLVGFVAPILLCGRKKNPCIAVNIQVV